MPAIEQTVRGEMNDPILIQPAPLSLKEIQLQALDDETLMLEYALGAERSFLWAVTAGSIASFELTGRDEIHLYFNQSGNSWSEARALDQFPRTDNLSSVTAVDLLGNGTACLVWSSPLPGDASRPMRYVDLMGGQKPHLMVEFKNNLGAETRAHYAASTKFYLADKAAGKPWVTRLPFPVHTVEMVETIDRISRNLSFAKTRFICVFNNFACLSPNQNFEIKI